MCVCLCESECVTHVCVFVCVCIVMCSSAAYILMTLYVVCNDDAKALSSLAVCDVM